MATNGIVDIKLESKSLTAAAHFFNHLVFNDGTKLPTLNTISLDHCEGSFLVRITTGLSLDNGIDAETLKRVKKMKLKQGDPLRSYWLWLIECVD